MIRLLLLLLVVSSGAGAWYWHDSTVAKLQSQIGIQTARTAAKQVEVDQLAYVLDRAQQAAIEYQNRLIEMADAHNAAILRAQQIEVKHDAAIKTLARLRVSNREVADWTDQPVPDDVAGWLREFTADTGTTGDH